MQQHWETYYASTAVEQTGFWEPTPEASLRLVERCNLASDELILDAGGGASTFSDRLLERGYTNLAIADISGIALERGRERLGVRGASVQRLVADLADPGALPALHDVALWHDRAVLHFLVDEQDREAYAQIVHRVLRPRGFVALAAFSLTGAPDCSGLPVRNYDVAMFQEVLGLEFRLEECFEHVYINPAGEPRPYVYALFQREG